jgi:ABC-2 type transport system permease protein
MPESLAGTGALIRLAVRRDRWLIPAWTLGLALMAGFSAGATADLYPDAADRISAAEVVNATPSLVALYGRVYDPTSLGALSLIKLTAFGAAAVAILVSVITVRHTRAEEAENRLELLAAGVVGRDAPLAASLVVSVASSLLIGLVTAAALVIAGLPATGSLAFGLAWSAAGIAFAGVAAVTSQVTTTSRAATGLALLGVGLAYVLRAIGDTPERGPTLPTWLSPIGWTQQIRPFAGNRFALVALPAAFAVVLSVVAFVLRAHRDLGAGLLSERRGPAEGRMASAWHLAARLDRGMLAAWAVGIVFFGGLVGSLTSSVTDMLDSPAMREFFAALGGEKALVDGFLSAELAILGSIVAAYGISGTAHLRSEEASGRAEVVLAASPNQWRWATSHFAVSLGGVALLMTLAGLAVATGHALDVGNTDMFWEIVLAAIARIPAAWVLASLVVFVFGWLPHATTWVWGVYAAFVVLVELGALWNLPSWLVDISPFTHTPKLPGAEDVGMPLMALTLVAAILAIVGFVGWNRRDLAD